MTENHSKWSIQQLKEITQCLDAMRIPINSNDRAKMKGDIPYYGVNGEVDRVNKHIFDEELLLLAEDGGNWGKNQKCAYIIKGKSWVNNHAHVLRPEGILIKFLESYLNFADLTKYVSGTTRGKLNQKQMNEIPIPVPPLNTQKKIVSILEKAEELKRKRKEANQFTNRILQSLFLKMFGNPHEISSKYRVEILENLALRKKYAISSGPFGSNLGTKDYVKNGVLVIRGTNVKTNEFDTSDRKYVTEEKAKELQRSQAGPRDLIVVAVGASGRACVIPDSINQCILSQNCNKISLDESLAMPEYVCYLLNTEYFQSQLNAITTDTVRKFLSMTNLANFEIPIPHINQQQEFVNICKIMYDIKQRQKESTEDINSLINSIMHKIFNGKLVN